jgi:hypothetical protein
MATSRPFAGLQKVNLNGVRFRLIDAKDQVMSPLPAGRPGGSLDVAIAEGTAPVAASGGT